MPQITCVSRIDEVVVSGGDGDGDDGAGGDAAGRGNAAGRSRGRVVATRSVEGGFETLESALPALLTVTSEANDPRPPSVKLVMVYKDVAAEALPEYDDSYLDPEADEATVCMLDRAGRPVCRAKVVQWDHAAIGCERDLVGLRGSPTRVKEIESVVLAQSEARMVEADEAGIAALVHELIEEHILG